MTHTELIVAVRELSERVQCLEDKLADRPRVKWEPLTISPGEYDFAKVVAEFEHWYAQRKNAKTALVEIEYDDDGPAMAGYAYGRSIRCADIIEVEATTESEAVQKVTSTPIGQYRTLRRATFKRWMTKEAQ